MAASASIVDLSQARATQRESPDPHAPSTPRFIVQQGREAGTRRVVSYATGRPVNDAVYTDADGNAPFDLRDRLNAEAAAEIDTRVTRLPRQEHLLALFRSAETQRIMSDILEADARDAAYWLGELVDEFDAAYTEATADR